MDREGAETKKAEKELTLVEKVEKLYDMVKRQDEELSVLRSRTHQIRGRLSGVTGHFNYEDEAPSPPEPGEYKFEHPTTRDRWS